MPVAAVIFDLYGTLVPEFPRSAFYETVAHMAATLGADPVAFRTEWDRTAVGRQTGSYPDGMPGNLRAVCAALGVASPSDAAIDAALAPRDAGAGRGPG